jgi:hypothetical protein
MGVSSASWVVEQLAHGNQTAWRIGRFLPPGFETHAPSAAPRAQRRIRRTGPTVYDAGRGPWASAHARRDLRRGHRYRHDGPAPSMNSHPGGRTTALGMQVPQPHAARLHADARRVLALPVGGERSVLEQGAHRPVRMGRCFAGGPRLLGRCEGTGRLLARGSEGCDTRSRLLPVARAARQGLRLPDRRVVRLPEPVLAR